MCYAFFILATFIVQIVMFNMLIAIMGDTFDKVTEFRDINATKSKLELMSDLVAIMDATDKEENEESFLFIVKPVNEDDDDTVDQWQGSIKTMTHVFERSIKKLFKSVEASKQDVKTVVMKQAQESEAKINTEIGQNKAATDAKIDETKAAIDAKIDAVDAKIDAVDAKINETQAANEANKAEILAAIAELTTKQVTTGPKVAFVDEERKD